MYGIWAMVFVGWKDWKDALQTIMNNYVKKEYPDVMWYTLYQPQIWCKAQSEKRTKIKHDVHVCTMSYNIHYVQCKCYIHTVEE